MARPLFLPAAAAARIIILLLVALASSSSSSSASAAAAFLAASARRHGHSRCEPETATFFLCPSSSAATTTTTRRIRTGRSTASVVSFSSNLRASSSSSSGDGDGKQRQQRKNNAAAKRKTTKAARFRQPAHAATATSAGTATTTTKNGGVGSSGNENDDNSNRKNSDPKIPDNDRMWKSRRSIEELESSLSRRYGTDPRRWTAASSAEDDGEFEEGMDDDGEYVGGISSAAFSARPVLDPWEEQQAKKKGRGRDTRRTRGRSDNGGGYDNNGLDFTHLIANKPVGGRGTNEVDEDGDGDLYDDDDDEEEEIDADFMDDEFGANLGDSSRRRQRQQQGGFFFSPPSTRRVEADNTRSSSSNNNKKQKVSTAAREQSPEPVESARKKAAPTVKQLNAVVDENGAPLYLTTEQAQRNFQAMLEESLDEASSSSAAESFPQSFAWEDLGITSPRVLERLDAMGCPAPLAVQSKAVPHILDGKDVVVGTYTGSGKTLAFLAPLVQRLLEEDGDDEEELAQKQKSQIRGLIVAPGRELASQIADVARDLLDGTEHKVLLAIGGTTFARSVDRIRKDKPSILVGTPGRLAELFAGRPGQQGSSSFGGRLAKSLGSLDTIVLDEFDALLEYKAHREPTQALLQLLKSRKPDLQSILCSATASDMLLSGSSDSESVKLEGYLRPGYVHAMADRDDVLVTPVSSAGGSAAESLSDKQNDELSQTTRVSRTVIHGVVHVPQKRFAIESLRRILHTDPLPQQILVFVDNSRKVSIVVEKLQKMGIVAAPLRGGAGSDKADRSEVSKALREGYVGLVVSTELAARGLDAPLLTHVINLDLPTDASHYAHRAGRCGRGGRPGVVINLTTSPQERHVPKKLSDQLGIEMYTVEPRNGRLNIVDPTSMKGVDTQRER